MEIDGAAAGGNDVPHEHRGIDWPEYGGNPFDGDPPWPGQLYWAHEQPSRVFPADRVPSEEELWRAIPMGYTNLSLLDRIALFHRGRQLRRGRRVRHPPRRARYSPTNCWCRPRTRDAT